MVCQPLETISVPLLGERLLNEALPAVDMDGLSGRELTFHGEDVGGGDYEGVVSELLAEEDVSPVCSPALLKGKHPLRSPRDLRHHRLIHDNFRITWATWLDRAGLDDIDPARGVTFESAAFAVEAAVQGQGVLLGRSALVSADLATGRLVRPFELALKSRWRYYVVYPEGALHHRKVEAFRNWLFSEMAADSAGTGAGVAEPV
jgi:LysR family glycine cleavage system transcriptional activator